MNCGGSDGRERPCDRKKRGRLSVKTAALNRFEEKEERLCAAEMFRRLP